MAQSLRNVTKMGMNGADTLLQARLYKASRSILMFWEPKEQPNLNLWVGYPCYIGLLQEGLWNIPTLWFLFRCYLASTTASWWVWPRKDWLEDQLHAYKDPGMLHALCFIGIETARRRSSRVPMMIRSWTRSEPLKQLSSAQGDSPALRPCRTR